MTLKSARSLFAATVKLQLRGAAMAALALTFLATGGTLKAQCARIDSGTPQYYNHNGIQTAYVHVTASPNCSWLLDYEAGTPSAVVAFISNRWGTGSAWVSYRVYPNTGRGEERGNIHVHGYPYDWVQIRVNPSPY